MRLPSSLLFALSFSVCVSIFAAETTDFEMRDLQGNKHRLVDYRGKWVVVNYWATWCPPCIEEIAELELFHTAHKDTDAVVLGVNMEDISIERLKRFVDEQFISYPILRSKLRVRTPLGPVTGLPTTYLVSPQGKTVARRVGPVTVAVLEAYLGRYNERNKARPGKQK